MKFIKTYFDINIDRWNHLKNTSYSSTWFQTPNAYNFFMSLDSIMEPYVFALERDDTSYAGVIVGYINKEQNFIKQYLSRRAIIIGGPMLADDITKEELRVLLFNTKDILKSKSIYIETRNFNSYEKYKPIFEECGFCYKQHLNFHIDTSNKESIDLRIGKNRKRDIKTSFRDGAKIIEATSLEQIKDYYSILNNLYKTKVKTPLFPFVFFENLFSIKDSVFLLVEFKGEIIGGTVCVKLAQNTLYEWFVCGRDNEWKSIFPSSVATYAGIHYAADCGCKRFDMMGAGTPTEAYGVRDFKARFGGEEVEYGRFIYICNPILYKIGELGVKLLKKF